VRVKELPEVDDEWARSMGEDFDSVATLRAKIRENRNDRRVRKPITVCVPTDAKAARRHPFEVPQSLIDQQTSFRLESVVRDMIGRGVDPRSQNLNWEGAREELKGQAEQDVRGSLLLERIAEEEKIDVSNDEIEAEIQAIARTRNNR